MNITCTVDYGALNRTDDIHTATVVMSERSGPELSVASRFIAANGPAVLTVCSMWVKNVLILSLVNFT